MLLRNTITGSQQNTGAERCIKCYIILFFDKGEEISTHESGGDAFVTCLDGVGEITINGEKYELHEGESIIMLKKNIRMQCTEKSSLRCCLSLYFNKNM